MHSLFNGRKEVSRVNLIWKDCQRDMEKLQNDVSEMRVIIAQQGLKIIELIREVEHLAKRDSQFANSKGIMWETNEQLHVKDCQRVKKGEPHSTID